MERITAYHHQANGVVECFHRLLKATPAAPSYLHDLSDANGPYDSLTNNARESKRYSKCSFRSVNLPTVDLRPDPAGNFDHRRGIN